MSEWRFERFCHRPDGSLDDNRRRRRRASRHASRCRVSCKQHRRRMEMDDGVFGDGLMTETRIEEEAGLDSELYEEEDGDSRDGSPDGDAVENHAGWRVRELDALDDLDEANFTGPASLETAGEMEDDNDFGFRDDEALGETSSREGPSEGTESDQSIASEAARADVREYEREREAERRFEVGDAFGDEDDDAADDLDGEDLYSPGGVEEEDDEAFGDDVAEVRYEVALGRDEERVMLSPVKGKGSPMQEVMDE